jgi:nucleoside-diphosphate-sugar epimerase
VPTTVKDVRDVEAKDIEGHDAIIHLAGLSNDPLGDYQPALTDEINHLATVRLGGLAKAAGVKRFLFASSCSNYGQAGEEFLDETSKPNPVTPYGVSKVMAEKGLSNLADHRFSPTYMRASTVYGFSPRIRFDLVLNNLSAWAFTTGFVFLKSDGTPWRPIVHVEDVCRAYLAALRAPRETVHTRAFNVGLTTENYQISELAEIVRDEVPESGIRYASDAGPDKRCYRVACERIARDLPTFKPQWTALRGVRQLVSVFGTTSLTMEEFEGERYQRIAHLKKLVDAGEVGEDLRPLRGKAKRVVNWTPLADDSAAAVPPEAH